MTARSRRRRYVLAAALCAAASCAGGDDRYRDNAEELAKVRNRIESVSKAIERDKGERDQLRAAVESAERKVDRAGNEARRIAAEIELQSGKVRQAEADQSEAELRLAAQKDALARQLRAAYMIGRGGRAELLLGQEDAARADRMLVYYDSLNQARTASIRAIDADIARLAELQKACRAQLDSLHTLQERHREAVAQLEADRSERSEALAQLSQRLSGESEELKGLRANEKQLHDLLEKLHEALADVPVEPQGNKSFPEMRGKLTWPLRGEVLAHYGESKAGGKLQWKGLWIGAPEGAPVHASARGRVAYVGWLSSYGLIVVLQHEKGYFTLYGHNRSVEKGAGDWVGAGEVIAQAGNTGGYEQPGLYFEVRKGTEPLDPSEWLMR